MKILFKALRLDGKGWAHGSHIAPHAGCDAHVISCENGFGHEVDGGTVCQYTGLEDKNADGLYSGDIYETDRGNVRVVYYSELDAQFKARSLDKNAWGDYDSDHHIHECKRFPFEITGNIHDTEASDD